VVVTEALLVVVITPEAFVVVVVTEAIVVDAEPLYKFSIIN
jgi:hypothetical protein